MRFRLFILSVLIAVSASAQQQFVSDGQNLWGFPGGSIMSVGTAPVVGGGSNLVWYGAVNRLWSNGANWSNAVPPGASDTATFNNAGNGNTAIGLGVNSAFIKDFVFTNSACAAYNTGSNTTETLNWTSGGTITMYTNAGNNISLGGRIYVGSSTGASTYTIANYTRVSKNVTLSQGNGRIEGLPSGNGDVTLNLYVDLKNGQQAINLAGQIKNATNGAPCKITRIVKTGAGLATIGSGTPANTFVADIYINEGCMGFQGSAANLIAGNRLFINTNACLAVFNAIGNYTGITNYWNGDFSVNDNTYISTVQPLTFGANSRVYLGQYGTDAVRTVDCKDNTTLTLNCPVEDGSNGFTKGLRKIGPATLVLSGTNTYTASTIVTNGLLQLNVTNCIAATNLQVIAPGIVFCRTNYCFPTNVTINLDGSFGKLRLSNNVPQSVAAFYTNGVLQASGTWGATGSGCQNTNNNCFLGAGVISVP